MGRTSPFRLVGAAEAPRLAPPQIHATRQREAELPIPGAYWASRIEDGTEMTVM